MNLRFTGLGGDSVSVPASRIRTLKKDFGGELLTATSPGYDAARSVWNAMIDRRPALIARCSGPADVSAAIRFAADHGLLVSVRGGGHNIAGSAVCDGGLVVDLSPMREVQVDPARHTARVQGGCTLGDLDRATQEHGLATPLGINSTTGVGGLTLGGGFGWLSRRRGLSIDNLESAEIVTADGVTRRASAEEEADLFWAVRGGSGNFGVATSFEFRLHPVGPEVTAGLVVHPLEAAGDVLRFYRDFLPDTPEEFTCWFVLRQAPPLPFLPEEWHGRHVLALALFHPGAPEAAERVMAPLRSYGRPVGEHIGRQPYAEWQQVLDPLLAPGARNYWKSHDFAQLSDGLIDELVTVAERIPDPMTEIAFAQLGGAVSRVPAEETAYAHRDGQFVLNVHGRWQDPARDQTCIEWAREVFRATAPYATGQVYVNFLTQDEEERVRQAFGPAYDRLAEVKRRYDPGNLFRHNMNIRPAGEAERRVVDPPLFGAD